jgi:hypothetical protein
MDSTRQLSYLAKLEMFGRYPTICFTGSRTCYR